MNIDPDIKLVEGCKSVTLKDVPCMVVPWAVCFLARLSA
jgi:hypothetical protein